MLCQVHNGTSDGYTLCPYAMLKGVLSKNLQKPYICDRGVYNSLGDDAYHVDTLVLTKTQGHRIMLGATDDRGGYHWSRCHTPLGRILQVFINKAF